jgi:uncharacterized protein YndB with AHSA1/START domain
MTDQEFMFDRTFDAPRAQVFRAFSFEELGDGRTRFTDSSLVPASAAEMFGGGGGASGAMDRLAELLAAR